MKKGIILTTIMALGLLSATAVSANSDVSYTPKNMESATVEKSGDIEERSWAQIGRFAGEAVACWGVGKALDWAVDNVKEGAARNKGAGVDTSYKFGMSKLDRENFQEAFGR
ncbi:hypothetical protein [Bacillus sp. RB3]|uniref:hypothetical protein n=1 Tax=Bacillus sp. RB3 TaxID=3050012 RepID=UPI00253F779E|nr:hypothetical protein [Bacillus sp. RB3]MDK3015847.1 hypothetical protein [Bacillus sp. RB3]